MDKKEKEEAEYKAKVTAAKDAADAKTAKNRAKRFGSQGEVSC